MLYRGKVAETAPEERLKALTTILEIEKDPDPHRGELAQADEQLAHRKIREAIQAHNPAEARRAMAVHVGKSRNQILKIFGGSP
ncbi:MAG TPA: hypothetical protein VM120_07625 [Bryobacteraceae bacterium]|nr:hypothetical protein [Bryobacteraceae bacterium]